MVGVGKVSLEEVYLLQILGFVSYYYFVWDIRVGYEIMVSGNVMGGLKRGILKRGYGS